MWKRAMMMVLLMAGLGSVGLAGEKNEVKGATEAADVFFNAYVKDVNAFIERTDRKVKETPASHWRRYFTPGLWAAYQKVLKTPDLDYDPLLQSNDVPDGFKVLQGTAGPDGKSAKVKLKYVGYVESTKPLEVRMKLVEGAWLVDGIGDLNR